MRKTGRKLRAPERPRAGPRAAAERPRSRAARSVFSVRAACALSGVGCSGCRAGRHRARRIRPCWRPACIRGGRTPPQRAAPGARQDAGLPGPPFREGGRCPRADFPVGPPARSAASGPQRRGRDARRALPSGRARAEGEESAAATAGPSPRRGTAARPAQRPPGDQRGLLGGVGRSGASSEKAGPPHLPGPLFSRRATRAEAVPRAERGGEQRCRPAAAWRCRLGTAAAGGGRTPPRHTTAARCRGRPQPGEARSGRSPPASPAGNGGPGAGLSDHRSCTPRPVIAGAVPESSRARATQGRARGPSDHQPGHNIRAEQRAAR